MHADGHSTALTPKRCELIVFVYLCLYRAYILNIYFIYILNQLGLITVKMADKIVMVTIKILFLK